MLVIHVDYCFSQYSISRLQPDVWSSTKRGEYCFYMEAFEWGFERINKYCLLLNSHLTKSLKMTKVSSEAINWRRTDNAMAKRKRTIGQTKIYKTLHKKLNKSSNTNPTKIRGELMCSGRVIASCVTDKNW